MTDSSQNTESSTQQTTTSTGYEAPADTTPKDTGPVLDENGYEIMAKEPDVVVGEPAKEEPAKEEPKTNDTGYGEATPEEKAAADKIESDKALAEKAKNELSEEDLKDADKLLKFEIKESLGKLPEGYDRDSIEKFVNDNKMTKEQVENYVEFAAIEKNAQNESFEAQKAQQKVDWSNELKNDADFGGDNFNINVGRAEKMLTDYMPNLKKALTDRGSMLPPYIMKDLASLAKTLNPTTTLVNGSPSTPAPKEDGNFLETMYS